MKFIKVKRLICFYATLLLISSANAKEYLGFNLCGKMTATQISNVTDIQIQRIDGLRQHPDEQVFAFNNFPVGKEFLTIWIQTYKELVYEIRIDTSTPSSQSKHTPSVEAILANKYQFPNKYERSTGDSVIKTYVANTRTSDSNLELTVNVQDWLNEEGKPLQNRWVIYSCRTVSENLKQAIKRLEIKKSKEAEGSTKF